jgi:hypothetical protein
MRGRRLPARLRILLAAAGLVAVHAFVGAPLEIQRIRVLAALPAWPGPSVGTAGEDGAHDSGGLLRRIDAWKDAREARLAAEGRAGVPVLDFRAKERIAILGAGSASGVRVLDLVEAPAGLLGVIDAVERRLSRVRLLSSQELRIPVGAAVNGRDLPGGVTALNAVIEGTGTGAQLANGSLLGELRTGDVLRALPSAERPDASSRPVPVGVVEAPGPGGPVRLLAGPGDLGLVTVPASGARLAPLFEDLPVVLSAAPVVGSTGALLTGAGAARSAPGCAVHVHGRYLGKVTLAAGNALVASRLSDPGHRVFVRAVASSGASLAAELVSIGGGAFRFEGAAPEAAGSGLLAVTAGGQELVPADLALGVLEPSGGAWVLDEARRPWPREATVSVFLAGDELATLLAR